MKHLFYLNKEKIIIIKLEKKIILYLKSQSTRLIINN